MNCAPTVNDNQLSVNVEIHEYHKLPNLTDEQEEQILNQVQPQP